MNSIHSSATGGSLLVSGASGALARQVIALLLRYRPHVPLIATTRQPDKLKDLAALGVRVRFADFDQPDSLDAAMKGASRMLLVSTNTPDAPPRRATQHGNAIDAARRCGVQHVVYTSFVTAGSAEPGPIGADHAATEQILQDGPMGYSILRNAFYAELLLATMPLACASGRLPCAPGRGRMTMVARADCAAAAAAALLDGFDTGERPACAAERFAWIGTDRHAGVLAGAPGGDPQGMKHKSLPGGALQ